MKRELILNVDGQEVTVTAVRDGDTIRVERDGTEYAVRIVAESVVGMQAARTQPTGQSTAAVSRPAPRSAPAPAAAKPQPAGAAHSASGDGAVAAPMTGVIDSVSVNPGDGVSEGDTVIVLEAMKMYIDVMAPVSGTVQAVSVTAGDSVKEGDLLLTIE